MNDFIYNLAKYYDSNPTLRMLVKLLPKGGAIDGLVNFYTKERERRTQVFFEELENGKIELTDEVINSDSFLHKYFITLKATLDTNRTEKIKCFAELLQNTESDI